LFSRDAIQDGEGFFELPKIRKPNTSTRIILPAEAKKDPKAIWSKSHQLSDLILFLSKKKQS
jgi:hypothetical protein